MASTSTITNAVFTEPYSVNGQYTATAAVADPLKNLKTAVWIYFILLIFEGALRKWVVPSMSSPLLIVRDPVALWMLFKARRLGILKPNFYLVATSIIIVVGVFTAVALGHGNLFVALYGARIFLIHFPLIFIIGKVFTRDDVVKLGKLVLWLSIPMTVLIALQFYSPQSAWVNRGVGGDMDGAGFNGGALGFYRPPGTFSFTNGNVLFYSFLVPFLFYFWIYPKSINRFLLLVSTACLFAAIPLSISRSLFFQTVITFLYLAVGISRKPKFVGKLIGALLIGIIAFAILSQTSFFKTSMEVFEIRYEGANESEGGFKNMFVDRYLGSIFGVVYDEKPLPFFGYGLGMGTSVGGSILSGKRGLLISEDEWGRLIGEMGLIMGLSIVFIRLGLYFKMLAASYKKLVVGDLLPWLLASFAMPNTPLGQWAQPAGLGFGIIISGLLLAALNPGKEKT